MSFGIAFIIVAALFGLFVFTNSFKIVGQAEVMVIERLGRFHRLARSGFNILIPFIERPKSIDVRFLEADVGGQKRIASRTTSRIDLREQVLNFPSQPVITKDNVTIDIDAVLYYRVADPQKATYSIQNLPYALETLTRTTLRNIVGDIELDQQADARLDRESCGQLGFLRNPCRVTGNRAPARHSAVHGTANARRAGAACCSNER